MKELYGIFLGGLAVRLKDNGVLRARRDLPSRLTRLRRLLPDAGGKENGSLLWLRIFCALRVKKMSVCLSGLL
jgi:hypothetical protein